MRLTNPSQISLINAILYIPRGNPLAFMIFRSTSTILILLLLLGSPFHLGHSQFSGVQGITEREIQRRQAVTEGYASEAINKGAEAMMARDYESAFTYYRAAMDALPRGGEASQAIRVQAMDGFSRASVSLARQRISEGRFEDAEEIVAYVLGPNYNPQYKPALELERQLADPTRFNRTMTPGFIARVEEVKTLLREAEGFYQSGRYDLAFRRYEQVLNLDKYNIAARRGMERVNSQRIDYATNAYNQTRASMLNEVAAGWELPVRRYDLGVSTIIEQPQIDITGTQLLNEKLNTIIIPNIEFRETTVREALDFIKVRAAALDTREPDPNRRGINIVLKLDPAAQAAESLSRINLRLSDLPLGAVLDYVAAAAGLKVKVEPYAVAIVPMDEPTEVLLTKEYNVPPSFVTSVPGADASGFGAPDPSAALTTRAGAREFLEAAGVTFPEGASAQFIPSSSKLIVRNTPSNLDLIDNLVEFALSTPPTQVEIQSKFLEVSQNNVKELGIDWLVGQFALPGGSGVYGGGGTFGNQTPVNASQFPMQVGGVPVGASGVNQAGEITGGTVTSGNRSGTAAISANALDGLLFAGPAGPAPGILALAGVFTNPQFQVVLRALDAAKGVDLMSAPSVTTRSGQRANIQVIREFLYPISYSPPEIPQTQATTVINPVTPATPQDFAMEPVGVELEVEPIIGPDGFTIELNLRPKVVEFEGFIDYGSPIFTNAAQFLPGVPLVAFGTRQVLLTENSINQPVFSYREVTTNVTIYDGQTIALGGLIREDVQKTEDKVPIIGDIPLLGRAFRTEASQHIKRNLIIFVTANLIDPAGQPVMPVDEDGMILPEPSATLMDEEIIYGDPSSIAPQL